MILYPAIDILHGRAVRLTKGDFDAMTVYEERPLDAARAWVAAGARQLHVVDLDGAKAGEPCNLDKLQSIVSELDDVPVQYGGGLRSAEAVRDALTVGARTVVLGTAALTDPELLEEVLTTWPRRVVVSVDARGGRATMAGWQTRTAAPAAQVVTDLQDRGVERFVYTDVDRDGMLQGPDLDGLSELSARLHDGSTIVYSGGIGSLEDLRSLADLDDAHLSGVIVGKALYERRFTIAEALQALL